MAQAKPLVVVELMDLSGAMKFITVLIPEMVFPGGAKKELTGVHNACERG